MKEEEKDNVETIQLKDDVVDKKIQRIEKNQKDRENYIEINSDIPR